MTQSNNNSNDSSSKTMMNRRSTLAAIGTGLVGGAVAADRFGFSFSDININIGGPDQPPLTEAEANPSGPHTPWDTDTVVIGFEWHQENNRAAFVPKEGFDELHNAVTFWNDYISENEPYDLTLTFDRHHDNPDIMLQQETILDVCSPAYKTPASDTPKYTTQVCVETLRESPSEDDLPVTAVIGRCGNGRNVYRLIAQHAIGRLIGYEIWSDPVNVMTPKITVAPSYESKARGVYNTPVGVFEGMDPDLDDAIEHLRNPERADHVIGVLVHIANVLDEQFSIKQSEMDDWLTFVNDRDMTAYANAYEQTIQNDEFAYVEDILRDLNALLELPDEELKNATDRHAAIADRLETISEWQTTRTPFDMRLHQHVTDALWSAWKAEQS